MKRFLPMVLLMVMVWRTGTVQAQDSLELAKQLKAFISEIEDSLKLDRTIFSLTRKSSLEVGLGYLSNNVYLGRKDTTVLPYSVPSLGYFHKSGIYASASAAYLHAGGASRFDLFVVEAGYMFSAGDYDGSLGLTHYFYNSQSTNVSSEIRNSISYSSGYDLGFIRPTLVTAVNFSNKPDFLVTLGLEHAFSAFGEHLDITPRFLTNAGTQNYYNDYYQKKRYSVKKRERKEMTGVAEISGTVLDASVFKVLDYEASVPVYYRAGRFTFYAVPTYVLPVHPATLVIREELTNGLVRRSVGTEELSNSFFVTVGIFFRI